MKPLKWMLAIVLLAWPGWGQVVPRADCATWDYGHNGSYPLFRNLWSADFSPDLQGYAQFGYYSHGNQTVPLGSSNVYGFGGPGSVNPPTSFSDGVHLNAFGGPFFPPVSGVTNGWALAGIIAVPDRSLPPCPAMSSGGTPIPPQFPALGLANGQTIRINVLANRAGSCAGTLSFVDSSLFHAIGPPAKVVNLASGQAASLDLVGASPLVAPGQRKQVVPRFVDSSGPPSACQASLEVFTSATGVTVTSTKWIEPVSQYDFDPQGLSAGQTLRINVTNPMVGNVETACGAALSFTDSTGGPLGSPLNQGIGTGGAYYFDLPSTSVPGLTGWAGGRVQVRPVLNTLPLVNNFNQSNQIIGEYEGGVLLNATCLASVEIFDTLSGLTRVVNIPAAVH